MTSLAGLVTRTLDRFNMLSAGQCAGLAVSGGADSVCLLHILSELAPARNLHLAVVHVDHGIRGPASHADAEFVAKLAEQRRLPFFQRLAEVDYESGNLEQTARDIRYTFFQELLRAGKVDRIATGHTLNDQAETVLYRILRGSGLTGLRGILPVTEDGVVRPLLEITRQQVEEYLSECDAPYRQDQTNGDINFARNRLRHRILPLLRSEFNPRLDHALANLAELARDEEADWEARAAPLPPGPVHTLDALELSSLSRAEARRRIRRLLQAVKGDLRQIEFAHIEAVLNLAASPEGHGRLQLPGLDLFRSFDSLRIAPAGWDSRRGRDFEFAVAVPGSVRLPCEKTLTLRLETPQMNDKLKDELDWQRLSPLFLPNAPSPGSTSLVVRNWRPGDAYHPAGYAAPHKIKSLFQEARIPLWERRDWPVLLAGDRILWAYRFGPAAGFKADARATAILRVSLDPIA